MFKVCHGLHVFKKHRAYLLYIAIKDLKQHIHLNSGIIFSFQFILLLPTLKCFQFFLDFKNQVLQK